MSLRHSIHSLAGQPRLEQVLQSLSKCLVSLWYSLILHDLRWSSMTCYSRANSANLHQLYVEPNDAKSKPPWKRPKDRAWATWQTFKWFYTNTSGNIPRPLWCLRWARRRSDVFAPATLRFRSEMQRNMRKINSFWFSGVVKSKQHAELLIAQSQPLTLRHVVWLAIFTFWREFCRFGRSNVGMWVWVKSYCPKIEAIVVKHDQSCASIRSIGTSFLAQTQVAKRSLHFDSSEPAMPTPCTSPCCCVFFCLRGLSFCEGEPPSTGRLDAPNVDAWEFCSGRCLRFAFLCFFPWQPNKVVVQILRKSCCARHCAPPPFPYRFGSEFQGLWGTRSHQRVDLGIDEYATVPSVIPCSTIPSPNISIFIHHIHRFIVLFADCL